MRPTSTRRCLASNRSAIPSPRRPRPSNRVHRGVATIASRRPVVSRATTARPVDATGELFDSLSVVAAVDASDDGERRPAVAFTCSPTSTSSPSSSSTSKGRGLFATRDLEKGEVALRVPGSLCLVVDYSRDGGGLSLPAGDADGGGGAGRAADAWPRTRAAVARDPETPWDLLLALALLDAVSGDGGGRWWESFAEGVLPLPSLGGGFDGDEGEEGEGPAVPPSLVTLPLCLPASLLSLAGHGDLSAAAGEQQGRLRELYPALAAPASADAENPTMMQWALACVRSRAFALGGGGGSGKGGDVDGGESELAFAFVPLLDCANHSDDPNAAFRPVWKEERGGGSEKKRTLDCVELVAVKDVKSGSEVLVSYTGPGGATNRRLMAQYGFVPAGGNAADRVEFDFERAAEESGLPPGSKLDLDRLQDLLGPAVSSDIMRGKNLYLFAAIKSLPLASSPPSPSSPQQHNARLARALLSQVEEQLLEVDEARRGEDEEDALLAAEAERRSPGSALAAVLRYRAERGSLLRAARAALRLYCAAEE